MSKLLGLGYPGGPVIDGLAVEGDPKAFSFPRAYLPESFDFSFSGLKTAVRNKVQGEESLIANPQFVKDISASFQAAVVDVLVRKVEWAIVKKGIRRVTMAGGVAANSALRRRMEKMAADRDVELYLPSRNLCTDNAAMISAAGYHHFIAGKRAGIDLNPKAYLPLGVKE